VDGKDTTRPRSDAVLLGNIIVKDPRCKENRSVIHFGHDGGKERDGTLYLLFNTIVTPFPTPVVVLSAAKARAHLAGNLVADGGSRQRNQRLASVRGRARLQNVTGTENWFSGAFNTKGTSLDASGNRFRRAAVLFVNPAKHDYRLTKEAASLAQSRWTADKIKVPPTPGAPAKARSPLDRQYRHPAGTEKRSDEEGLTLGGYGR
jgi:hypothetical protein